MENKLILRQISVNDLFAASNFDALIEEYAEEAVIIGLPPIKVKVDLYQHYEKTGAFYLVAAYLDELLIGFATVLSPIMPHFSALVSVCESLFVLKEFRNTGAGLKLIRNCENHAANLNSPGLLISSPIGGSLEELLQKKSDYKETNKVFFKEFKSE